MSTVLRSVRLDAIRSGQNIRADLGDLGELAGSIAAHGLLQPILVADARDHLVTIDGHRRVAAARRAGLVTVPALVRSEQAGRKATVATMLAAGLHKELAPVEQARAFKSLRDEGMTLGEMVRATGYAAATIRGRLLLLDLPDEVQDMVTQQEITLGVAVSLAKQVSAKKSGSVSTSSRRSAWFTKAHRLALAVDACEHGETRTLVGGVACGQCWEQAIRADERGELDTPPPSTK